MKNHLLGSLALIIAVAALGLTVTPTVASGKPFPWFQSEKPPTKLESKPPAGKDTGISIKFGDMELKWPKRSGKKVQEADKPQNKDEETPPEAVREEIKGEPQRETPPVWFSYAALACALLGLTLGPIAWVREKEPRLSGSAVGICCLALVWQYLLLGLVIGVAVAVFLIILSYGG